MRLIYANILAVVVLMLAVACDNSIPESPSTGYGRIRLGISAEPEISITTRTVTTLTEAELANYNVTITYPDATSKTFEYSEMTEADLSVPVGHYTITVQNLTDAEAHPTNNTGYVQVRGESIVDVEQGKDTECSITCTPINSKVTLEYTAAFLDVFNTPTATLTQESRNVSISDAATPAYFKPGSVSWNIAMTYKHAADKEISSSGSFTTEAGKHSIIKFDISQGQLSVTVTVPTQVEEDTNFSDGFNPYQ